MDKILNGFNNGRDTTEGVGGQPGFYDEPFGAGKLGDSTEYIPTLKNNLYRKKPVVIEAITFNELVEYGISTGCPLHNGMPWSFAYNGYNITHENDACYLIPTLEGTFHMTPLDMLITGVKGEIYPCKIGIFEATYEKV